MSAADCEGHRCDECRTCKRGRCCRRDNPSYRLPETGEWEGPTYGELGSLKEDGDRVECHACGGWWEFLAKHVWYAHNLTAAEYRAMFGLGYTQPLAGARFRAMKREQGIANQGSADWMRSIRPTAEQAAAISARPERMQVRDVKLPVRRALAKAMPRYQAPNHRIRIRCSRCQKPFEVYPSDLRRGKYLCSIQCRAELKRASPEPPTNAKLTAEVAEAVRQRYREGVIQRRIAEEFGISQANVSLIVRNVTWRT